jgi:hypothetical protein
MDYPPPSVDVTASPTGDVLSLSYAYAASIGALDKVAITVGYREFDFPNEAESSAEGAAREQSALEGLLNDALTGVGYVL